MGAAGLQRPFVCVRSYLRWGQSRNMACLTRSSPTTLAAISCSTVPDLVHLYTDAFQPILHFHFFAPPFHSQVHNYKRDTNKRAFGIAGMVDLVITGADRVLRSGTARPVPPTSRSKLVALPHNNSAWRRE